MTTTTSTNNNSGAYVSFESPEKALKHVLSKDKFTRTYLKPIEKNSKALKELIQEAGIHAMVQAFAHDNFDYYTKLYNVLTNSLSKANGKQFKQWVEANAPCKLRLTKNGLSFRKDRSEKANEFDFLKAQQNPWYKEVLFDKEEVKRMLTSESFESSIKRLVQRTQKALQEQNVDNKEVPAIKAKLEVIEKLVA